jgi:hypothetical protein
MKGTSIRRMKLFPGDQHTQCTPQYSPNWLEFNWNSMRCYIGYAGKLNGSGLMPS